MTEVMEAGPETYYHRPSVRAITRSHEGASCSREEAGKWLEESIYQRSNSRKRERREACPGRLGQAVASSSQGVG